MVRVTQVASPGLCGGARWRHRAGGETAGGEIFGGFIKALLKKMKPAAGETAGGGIFLAFVRLYTITNSCNTTAIKHQIEDTALHCVYTDRYMCCMYICMLSQDNMRPMKHTHARVNLQPQALDYY